MGSGIDIPVRMLNSADRAVKDSMCLPLLFLLSTMSDKM